MTPYIETYTTGYILNIVINNEKKMNSLTLSMIIQLSDILYEIKTANNQDIRVVVIRGSGDKAFCAGLNLSEIRFDNRSNRNLNKRVDALFDKVMVDLMNIKKPTIAMINGHAIGAGLELSLCCDFRFAVEGVKVGIPAVKIGFVVTPNSIKLLLNTIGLSNTKDLLLSGRLMTSNNAKIIGLVNQTYSKQNFPNSVEAFAKELAKNAPISIQVSKEMINTLADIISVNGNNERYFDLLSDVYESEDFSEGVAAFKDKRQANFKGR